MSSSSSSSIHSATAASATMHAGGSTAAPVDVPYVVIPYSAFSSKKRNQVPFSKVLTPLRPHVGTKTRESAFAYIFRANCDGKTFWKVGNTGQHDTYKSKNRFCPFVEYHGVLQVLGHGTLIERLLARYFRGRYKASEWYYGCEPELMALIAALTYNRNFIVYTPHRMTNIEAFNLAFIGVHGSTIDSYLSLFRVEDHDGRLYRLTIDNIERSLARMLTPAFLDEEASRRHQQRLGAPAKSKK